MGKCLVVRCTACDEMMMLHCHESHDAELMMAIMMSTMMNISRGSMKMENLYSVKMCPSDN